MTRRLRTLWTVLAIACCACAPDPVLDGGAGGDAGGNDGDGGAVVRTDGGQATDGGASTTDDAGSAAEDAGAADAGRVDAGLDDDGGALPPGTDEAGDQNAATQVGSVPFRRTFDLQPGATDEDCWRFSLALPSTLSATTTAAAGGGCGPSFDTYLELFDEGFSSTGPFLLRDADNDMDDFCAAMDLDVAAGTYTICATSAVDADLARVQIDVDATPLDVVDDAPNAPAGATSAGSAPIGGTFDLQPGNDVDCLAFTTGATGTLTVAVSDGAGGCPGDTFVELYDDQGFVASNDDDGVDLCAALVRDVPAGGYVACVTAANPGDQASIAGVRVDATVVPGP